jgi:hypothetical protein
MLIPAVLLVPTWFIGGKAPRVSPKNADGHRCRRDFLALDLAFFNTSILQTSAANATLPAVLAAIILAEPLSTSQIIGGALVLAGVDLANRRIRPTGEVPANLLETSQHK